MNKRQAACLSMTICVLCSLLAWTPISAQCSIDVNQSAATAEPFTQGNSGAVVLSMPDVLFFSYYTPAGLFAIHGSSDLIGWCATGDWSLVDFSDWQVVLLPHELSLLSAITNGDDISTSIYELVNLPPEELSGVEAFCWIIEHNEAIATGTADILATDNDYFGDWFLHRRHHAFGANAHGVLTTPDGERVVLNSHLRCNYAWVDGEYCGECQAQIQMQ